MARGSILKRNRNNVVSYLVRVEYDPDPVTGKRRQRSESFRLRKDADKRLSAWLSEIDRGTAIEPTKMTVAVLLNAWLDDIATHAVRPSTLTGYRYQVEKHIIPELGSILVQKLTAARVQAFYSAKLKAGASPRMVQLCHLRLNQALNQAVKWSIVPGNVCAAVDPPSVTYKQSSTWNSEQLRAFLATAKDDTYHPLWLLLATTGMRRGEALGLRWRDLDLDQGLSAVQQSVIAHKGAPLIQAPKTAGSRRSIKLLPEATKALKEFRGEWAATKLAAPPDLWEDTDLIFCTALGRPINPNNITRNYERILVSLNVERKANNLPPVPRIRVHDLRHTHATLLLRAGTAVKVVSERLGHAKVSITLDTYAHVLPDMQDRAVEAFSAMLKDGAS